MTAPAKQVLQPWWGEPIPGQTLWISAEGDPGVTLQHCRWLPRLLDRVGNIVLAVPSELTALLQESFLGFPIRIHTGSIPTQSPDAASPLVYCHLRHLPELLGLTADDLPGSSEYLRCTAAARLEWGSRLAPVAGLRIGLALDTVAGPAGEIPPVEAWHALLSLPGIEWHLLKDGPVSAALLDAGFKLTRHEPDLHDFNQKAALIERLDGVVAVNNNSEAHLAAAMGQHCWMLQAQALQTGDLGDGERSPWYLTLHLYRQGAEGDWDSALERLRQDILPQAHDSPCVSPADEPLRVGAPMPRHLVPFLQLDEAAIQTMVPQGVVRQFARDELIIQAGDTTDSLYVLLQGRVKVFVSDESGREFILNTIGTGDYFGEVALDGGPRTASIMAIEACRCFVIPKLAVKHLIESHPDFSRDLIGRLLRKIRSLADSVHNLALMSAYCRLVKFLDDNASGAAPGRREMPRLTQHDIAMRIGASREMVSRLLADLANCGYIAIENKRIVVLRDLPER